MSFRKRLVRVAALGLAVAAVGAPATYPQSPTSGEGYGGSMDAGSPVNYGVVDFWNYDSDSGMRISNYSPGVAAADLVSSSPR